MKLTTVILSLLISLTAYAGHGVERGSIRIDSLPVIKPEIAGFITNKLNSCARAQEITAFKFEKMEISEVHVDQGIVDVEYSIQLSYSVFKEDVPTNTITVKILDSDFDNWRNYEERLSFEITEDQNNKCN